MARYIGPTCKLARREGADLRAILEHETEAHGPQRISLNGPRLELPPAAAPLP